MFYWMLIINYIHYSSAELTHKDFIKHAKKRTHELMYQTYTKNLRNNDLQTKHALSSSKTLLS